ncbi:hypothetical protein [Desulfonatronum thioautotrophicum]|uniref:hypothetical protein n=1 Tax=Desulfonatronum thioautotrophicum TaxID=617001 RepID=UPI0005EB2A85|nr:hypothetical protein [Desulfonatronum thioautotrophicum]
MGDPDFDMSVDAPSEEVEGDDLRSVVMKLKVFRRLPGTLQEVEAVSSIVGPENSVVLTRERHGHANPFYWGGFIFSGDPRNP